MTQKYQHYFAIEKKMKSRGLPTERAELIYTFTNGKKDSLKALTSDEYVKFISWLNLAFSKKLDWQNSPENVMRRKIWGLMVKKMKYTEAQMYRWVEKYGLFHKSLKEHNRNELSKLVTQVEKMYLSYIKEIGKKQ